MWRRTASGSRPVNSTISSLRTVNRNVLEPCWNVSVLRGLYIGRHHLLALVPPEFHGPAPILRPPRAMRHPRWAARIHAGGEFLL